MNRQKFFFFNSASVAQVSCTNSTLLELFKLTTIPKIFATCEHNKENILTPRTLYQRLLNTNREQESKETQKVNFGKPVFDFFSPSPTTSQRHKNIYLFFAQSELDCVCKTVTLDNLFKHHIFSFTELCRKMTENSFITA